MIAFIRSRIDGPRREAVAFSILAFGVGCILQFSFPNLPDGDAFYHMGHAAAYAENGPFLASFPWLTLSEIGRLGGDLWYGFHLLLMPFAMLFEPIDSLRIAGAATLALMLLGVHLALRGADWRLRWLAPMVVLAASASELMRWLALRPQLLSLGLSALLLWALSSDRPRRWQVAVLAAAVSWMHLAFFWLPIVVVLAAGLSRYGPNLRGDAGTPPFWQTGLAAIAGVLAGALLRPAPIATLELLKIQLIDLGAALRDGIQLSYGGEVEPISGDVLRDEYAPFFALWLFAIVVAVALLWRRKLPDEKLPVRMLMGSFLVSLAGYTLATQMSSRGLDIWVVFGAIFAGYALSMLLGAMSSRGANALILVGAALLVFAARTSFNTAQLALRDIGLQPRQFEKAMAWLRSNSPPGSVVATPSWSSFGPMFIWSRNNRHLAGMDPIFQYKRDPRRYWVMTTLALTEGAERINVALPGEPPLLKDTVDAIREDLAASWLIVVAENSPKLFRLSQKDPRFRQVFVDGTVIVYAL